jgi:tRNA-dependent cyclodipeptide synthase
MLGQIHTTYHEVDGLRLAISARSAPFGTNDLAGRTGHMMISIKNRVFNARLIDAFCGFAGRHLARAHVTVVDTPYLHNVAAIYADPAERERKAASVFTLADERVRQVRKLLARHDPKKISLHSWNDLAAAVPQWLTDEIKTAFNRRGRFRAALTEQCRRMVNGYASAGDPDAFELFLLEETPVLLYAYYLFHDGIVDFYPGVIGDYFWEIEQGVFSDELPRTTELARRHPGLVYVELGLAAR